MSELNVGDKVRVKHLAAIGTIRRVSTRLRHSPYLVEVTGYGTWSYSAEQLEKLPSNTVLTLPPAISPIKAVCGASGQLVCGVTNCLRILDPAVPTCPKCGTLWVL